MQQHIRIAIRSLFRAKVYTAAAVLSLAIGIGGNTAIFSLVNAVVLRPLPYQHPDRLLSVSTVIPKVKHLYPTLPVTAAQLVGWQQEAKSFEHIGALIPDSVTLTGSGDAQRVAALAVSPELLLALGATTRQGRLLSAQDAREGAARVVLLSESMWRSQFAADPSIVGRKILLDGVPMEVAGVLSPLWLPQGRQLHPLGNLPANPGIILPVRIRPQDLTDHDFNLMVIGRLRAGATIAQATAELEAVNAAIAAKERDVKEIHVEVRPLQQTVTSTSASSLALLLGAVALVLLIVCVNIANLTLVRAASRRKEYAIRAALGAGREWLLRHSLLESLLVSLCGTVLGLVASLWIVDLVKAKSPVQIPRLEQAGLDVTVVVFAIALCLFTTILFGLLPAWRASRSEPGEALQTGGRGNTDTIRGNRLRSSLVSVEVAMSTALLICAALLLGSFLRVIRTDRGFDATNVIAARISLAGDKYRTVEQRTATLRRLLATTQSLPGTTQAGYISLLPLTSETDISMVVREGGPPMPLIERPITTYRKVSAGYFPAMGIPLRSGRLPQDEGEKELVAIISEGAARKVWPNENAIGKRFQRGGAEGTWIRVIGIVGDVRSKGLDREPEFMVYQPFYQRGNDEFQLVLRTSAGLPAVSAALRETVRQIDSDIPFPEPRVMESIVSQSVAQRRFQALLISIFAGVALLLACIGIYGVASYSVAQRRAEIGIRLALGATQSDVRRDVVRNGMLPVVAGLCVGIVTAAGASQLIAGMLFGFTARDPLVYGGVVAMLALTGLAACYMPARRAASIPPMEALRYE